MWIHAVDLGMVQDFTAHVVCRTVVQTTPAGLPSRPNDGKAFFEIVHLERYRGTPYTEVVRRVRHRIDEVAFHEVENQLIPQPQMLTVDGTGVGGAVVSMFREAGLAVDDLVPVIITGGLSVTFAEGYVRVPKRELVSVVSRVAGEGRLRISPRLSLAKTLQAELRTFTVKLSPAGNDQFEAARERDHDDLVLATALALYAGELAASSVKGGAVQVEWR